MTTEEKLEETISAMSLNAATMAVAPTSSSTFEAANQQFEKNRKELRAQLSEWRAEIKAEVKKEMGYEL